MARRDLKFVQNVEGSFYVDATCIDCERCRKVAPAHFAWDANGHSFVFAQPQSDNAIAACEQALAGCPVGAIGNDGTRHEPSPLKRLLPDLYACCISDQDTDYANAYVIVRPGGNILIDVPALSTELLRQLERLGDLRYIFLTHEDTMGDVTAFQAHFGAEVLMHRSESHLVPLGVSRPFDADFEFDLDVTILHTPGHTVGSSCLLWKRHGGCLFVGDHLLPSEDGLVPIQFEWTHDWQMQCRQAARLLELHWNHAFPAHDAELLPRGYLPKARQRLCEAMEQSSKPSFQISSPA